MILITLRTRAGAFGISESQLEQGSFQAARMVRQVRRDLNRQACQGHLTHHHTHISKDESKAW